MNRNKNIEAVRGIAILCMLIYHYTLSITGFQLSQKAAILIESVGQFALLSFFVISGFGTYTHFLSLEEKKQSVSIAQYLKKRITRIIPQYYFCLFIIVVLTSGIGFLSLNKIKYLLESLILLQNFDPSNGVNGVTWTIAVLFQLYIFSKPLYNGVKRWGSFFYLFSVCFCVILKNV